MRELLAAATPLTRDDFARALCAFINGPLAVRRRTPAATATIDESTPLFESGVLDSLAIIDLLAFVEAAIGRRIPMRQIDMRYFGTIDRIVQTFASEPSGGNL